MLCRESRPHGERSDRDSVGWAGEGLCLWRSVDPQAPAALPSRLWMKKDWSPGAPSAGLSLLAPVVRVRTGLRSPLMTSTHWTLMILRNHLPHVGKTVKKRKEKKAGNWPIY